MNVNKNTVIWTVILISYIDCLLKTGLLSLLVYKSVNGSAPPYLQELLGYIAHSNSIKLDVPNTQSRFGNRAFSVIGPRILNLLPASIRESPNVTLFKKSLKTYLFSKHDIELNFDPKKSVTLHF